MPLTDWIITNKEWFLSGSGIFIITGLSSLLSVAFTLIAKRQSEKKRRKRLQLSQTLVKFELPETESGMEGNALSVSYKNQEYRHLCHYAFMAENTGIQAIQGQNLLFSFPEPTHILASTAHPSNASIKVTSSTLAPAGERLYEIDRIEPGERFSVTFLADSEEADLITCIPRGVDDIDYIWGKSGTTNDLETLVGIAAMLLLAGVVPYLSSMLQGVIVLISTPVFVRLGRKFYQTRKTAGSSLVINGGIKVEENAAVNISLPD